MQDVLETIFGNVNDWLKFAEAKSATLLAANGLVIFGILRLTQNKAISGVESCILAFVVGLFSISLLLCLASLIPSLELPFIRKKYSKKDSDNLLYFAHIENYTPTAYLNALYKAKQATSSNASTAGSYSELEKMYAKQIITNSVIASYKYSVFKKAIWATLLGGICSIFLLIVYMVAN